MIRHLISSTALAGAILLASCASGPSYSEAIKTMPLIPKGKGRVFVYREGAMGPAVRPQVRIDGTPIGTSKAKGFVYSDQAPGSHEVSLITEWKHKDTVQVIAGQPSFVRTHLTFGALIGHVIPTAVSRQEGEREIVNCKLAE